MAAAIHDVADQKFIGRYELLGRIGQGGMGTVFKAFDPVLERIVAVKVISAQLDQHPDARERFFREARAAGQLAHKNIVVVHDLGEHEQQPYLAMEFLDGENLEMRMRNSGRIRYNRAVRLVSEVCEGLDFAHTRGVLHRDIKPANLFLTDSGAVKVLDFGLARLVSSELTHSRTVVGTANYMCPEQVRGERVDQRSDIFSVGVVLYELLSGHKAFAGDSFATIVYKILQSTPEPLQKYDESIPRQLVDIVDRALAKNREDRYQSMAEMLRDIALCEQTIHGSDPSRPTPSWPVITTADAAPTTRSGPAPPPSGVSNPLTPWVAAALVVAAAGVAWLMWPKSVERELPQPPAAVQPAPPAPAPVPEPEKPAGQPAATPAAAPLPPPPSEAPRTAPPAAERARADEALASMNAAKADSTAAATGGPLARQTLQEALATERLGRANYARGRYGEAVGQIHQAAALFRSAGLAARTEAAAAAEQQKRDEERREQERRDQERKELERREQERREQEQRAAEEKARAAAAPPVTPPAEPTPPAAASARAAEAQILGVLGAYTSALEQRSVDALKRVWPGMDAGQERAIRNELSRARTVRVVLADPRIEVAGNTATATARRRYELQTDDGQRLSTETDTTFSLRKAGESWVIHDVVHRRP